MALMLVWRLAAHVGVSIVFGWLKKIRNGDDRGTVKCWPFCSSVAAVVTSGLLLAVVIFCAAVLAKTGSEWRDAIALREAEGKGLRVDHFVRWGLWRAALVDGLLALGLLLTRRFWWIKRSPESKPVERLQSSQPSSGRWWIAVVLLVVLAAGIRWPRMDLSLYNDEIAGFSRYIEGSFKNGYIDHEDETPAAFVETTWLDTLWGNRMANNHALFSALARLGYDSWQSINDGVPGQVYEIPLRLPALAGGLLSVLAIAGLGRAAGMSTGGLFAALLLALHPWHLRYSTEARGYGLLFGFGVLAAWCLVEALRDEGGRPRWRWWLAYALCQVAYLWANIGGVYLAAGINGLVLGGLAVTALRRGKFAALLTDASIRCLLIANILSAMLLMPLLLPSLPQVVDAMQRVPVFKEGIPFGFWPDVLSELAIGMPWHDGDPENRFNPAVAKYAALPQLWIGLSVAAVCFPVGLVALLRRSAAGAMVVIGALLGLALAWLNSVLTGATLLPWYVIFVLPFVTLACGSGVSTISAWIATRIRRGARAMLPRYVGYALVGLVLWAGYPALSAYQVIGKQATRGAIVAVRGGVYPYRNDEQKHPIIGAWWTEAGVYDPRLRLVWQVPQMQRLIERSRQQQRPMYFILGNRENAVAENAEVVKILEDPEQFELVKLFPGLEQRSYRQYLYRLK